MAGEKDIESLSSFGGSCSPEAENHWRRPVAIPKLEILMRFSVDEPLENPYQRTLSKDFKGA
tara:strand:- start:52518 stop:52703 length:186 start_codon:yes stop_codon:yes gene_type:complete